MKSTNLEHHTEEQLVFAEARLGKTFPPSYRKFLQVTNGRRQVTTYLELRIVFRC